MQFMPLDDSIIGIVITVIDPDESLAFLRLARKKKLKRSTGPFHISRSLINKSGKPYF